MPPSFFFLAATAALAAVAANANNLTKVPIPGCGGVPVTQGATSCDSCAPGLAFVAAAGICTGCDDRAGNPITAEIAAALVPPAVFCAAVTAKKGPATKKATTATKATSAKKGPATKKATTATKATSACKTASGKDTCKAFGKVFAGMASCSAHTTKTACKTTECDWTDKCGIDPSGMVKKIKYAFTSCNKISVEAQIEKFEAGCKKVTTKAACGAGCQWETSVGSDPSGVEKKKSECNVAPVAAIKKIGCGGTVMNEAIAFAKRQDGDKAARMKAKKDSAVKQLEACKKRLAGGGGGGGKPGSNSTFGGKNGTVTAKGFGPKAPADKKTGPKAPADKKTAPTKAPDRHRKAPANCDKETKNVDITTEVAKEADDVLKASNAVPTEAPDGPDAVPAAAAVAQAASLITALLAAAAAAMA